MNKLIASFFLVLAGCAAVPPAYASEVFPSEAVAAATVQLNKNCSGTIIHSKRDEVSGDVATYVLTAKHCTKDVAEKAIVEEFLYDDDVRRTTVVTHLSKVFGQWFKGDLALVKLVDTKKLFTNVAPVAAKEYTPFRGQDVIAIGFPMGIEKTVTYGNFVARGELERAPIKDEMLMTTVPVTGGSSGGGLYAYIDGEYKLIGVTSMTAQGFPWSFYVPIDQIRTYIDIAIKK